MDCNIKRDIEKIKDYVGANSGNTATDILFNILQIDTIGVDNTWFFDCIFENNKIIKKKAQLFLDSLNSNVCPFSLVHGYSKNGKSTFIEYVRYLNNQNTDSNKRINIIKFNFERGSERDYIDKIRLLWIDELCPQRKNNKCIEEFIEFYNFYYEFVSDLKEYISQKDGIIAEKTNKLTSYFDNFCLIGFDKLYEFIDKNKSLNNTKEQNRKYRKELTLFMNDLINEENCGNYFSLLILYMIFQSRYKLFYRKTKHQKLLFVLDNMDDYLNDKDLLFLQYPQIQISTFIYHFTRRPIISSIFSKTLKKYIKAPRENIAEWIFSFKSSINITYVFRTANFLAFSNIINEAKAKIGQSREKYFPECMLDINYYRINTINFTDDILSKRLNFATSLLKELNMKVPKGLNFLKILSSLDKNKGTDENIIDKSIFSLWNGDKKALIDYIISNRVYIEKNYFPSEEILLKCKNNPFKNSIYLLKGFYLYFFLYLFSQQTSSNKVLQIIYKYRKVHNKAKNIRRFLLNYIINNSENLINKPSTIKEIEEGGVGLYELLNEINNFIHKINTKSKEIIYSFENIENFFQDTYSNKIDYFAQFFTIYKTQIISSNGKEINTIYYNLSKELSDFNNLKDINKLKKLNKVRVFNNHNSAFLAKYFISHFELYSFSLSHDKTIKNLFIEKPLMLTAKKKLQNISSEKDYEFYEIIEKVFNNAKNIITSIVKFYLNYLISEKPPHKFVEDPLLTLFNKKQGSGDFQFRLIIRRHISYLEGFRFGIITNNITRPNFSKEEIKIANKYIINKILDYIHLYFDQYNEIKKHISNDAIYKRTILDIDYDVLKKYEIKAKKALIENEKYVFTQIIEYE